MPLPTIEVGAPGTIGDLHGVKHDDCNEYHEEQKRRTNHHKQPPRPLMPFS
eukprot:m.298033 g.298033  ORF g.298033 m.298033 type:complete len:51 (+) comp16291_c0_seq2:5615-5767(+)